MSGAGDQHGAELLVGEELDGSVREYAKERGRVAAEKPTHARLGVDVTHRSYNPEPGARVFGELGVGGLEEDFHPIERADDSLGLENWLDHAS